MRNTKKNVRGTLSDKVKSAAKKQLGREITATELRLMPYVQYEMLNSQKINYLKISPSERKVLSKWRHEGWLEGGASGLEMCKDFWDAISEILWVSYVVRD